MVSHASPSSCRGTTESPLWQRTERTNYRPLGRSCVIIDAR
jgi:hypothetical protein